MAICVYEYKAHGPALHNNMDMCIWIVGIVNGHSYMYDGQQKKHYL